MIHPARVHDLNVLPIKPDGKFVLYWMQASARVAFNHALEHAIDRANELSLPVVVCFGLMDDYPEANERHYAFLLQGLADVRADLRQRGIDFVVKHGSPARVAIRFSKDAALVVCDRGYTRHQKQWRDEVADGCACRVVQVESDVVVPVEEVSDKHESAARTIRPKIRALLEEHLHPLRQRKVKHPSATMRLLSGDIDVTDWQAAVAKLKLDRSVTASRYFIGGSSQAKKRLDDFLRTMLGDYKEGRNEPLRAQSSTMSPYLHFGQISPLQIALAVRDAKYGSSGDRESYLEELIVRRELSMNFCNYVNDYDTFEAIPNWARKSLREQSKDSRPVTYTPAELESAKTDDRWWNAAMMEMVKTGFMHNYMRMYWGKKILEWTNSPEKAFKTTLHLNNKYFIDGRDPNSFANVCWIYGLHDRPWGPRRKIFGLVRYMNAAGLARKFDIEGYAKKIESLP